MWHWCLGTSSLWKEIVLEVGGCLSGQLQSSWTLWPRLSWDLHTDINRQPPLWCEECVYMCVNLSFFIRRMEAILPTSLGFWWAPKQGNFKKVFLPMLKVVVIEKWELINEDYVSGLCTYLFSARLFFKMEIILTYFKRLMRTTNYCW